jgi:hypothetical protein
MAYPYNVPSWCPALIADVLSLHAYDPVPISTTVRKCASSFKESHQDTWAEDSLRFDEDQLSALTSLLAGSSYCEFHFFFAGRWGIDTDSWVSFVLRRMIRQNMLLVF